MKKLLPMADAEQILEPYYGILTTAVNEGMQDFNDFIRYENEKRHIPFQRRTKATLLNDYISNRLLTKCVDLEGVKVRTTGNNGFPFIIFDQRIIARVKKLNKELKPANIQTQITKAYNNQYQIEAFPENPTLVYFGYRVDSTISDVEGIYIVCRIKNQIQWYIDLTNGYSEEQSQITNPELPIIQTIPRIKIKTTARTSQQSNTGTDN